MKFLISVILTACIFGLTFSDPEKVTKSPQIETNNSESEWLSDTDLNLKVKKRRKISISRCT